MKNLIIAVFTVLLVSCANDSNSEKIKNLNGYWNIDLVEKPDGSQKEFPFTNHMDFFEVNGNSGTKSRVSPTYDGTFISYGDAVKFEWVDDENQVVLNFASGEQAYSQILRKANKDEMELVHEDGTVYYYKAYQPDAEQ
ncbi:lipocalin-like domain-containing protein [Nonlabens agnitus]|uniref:Lipocalin-like domain-containing protein n=1 Tax=Nonlabens agnitus TaxID=870484 RepID=A0A2S9WS82_9FLAO|nr:lipocalin family protein [Nonlabens agnitus]PRP66146.1 hypothetical protein BST86_03105 [Nonlabens agnitus]